MKRRLRCSRRRMGILLFNFYNYEHIARELRTIPLLQVDQFAIGRHDKQELHAKVQTGVSGQHCLVLRWYLEFPKSGFQS